MATFKAEVYAHQKRADGTFNIKIRVIHNRQKRYLATPWYVGKDDLTRSMKIKNQKYIDLTDQLIRKYRSKLDNIGEDLNQVGIDQIVEYIKADVTDHFDLDFVAYSRKFIQELYDAGHIGNSKAYKVALSNLIKFVGRDSISIKEITVKFISDWIKWIQSQPARPNRKKGDRAQSLYPSLIRHIYNLAKKEYNDEDAGVILIPYSPFKRVEIPKVTQTRKRALTIDQLRMLAEVPYTLILQPGTNRFNLAKDIFLLSFFLVGMNAVDLYNATDCKDGRITYQRQKTKNRRADNAEISIRIEPEAMPLIEKYRDPSGNRIFNFYKTYGSVDTFTVALNFGLKKIGKIIGVEDLEFYAARHTWATIASNDADVDKFTVHTALNHVAESMRVTDMYIRKSWDPIDKANRKVLDLLQLKLDFVEPTREEKDPK